MAHGVEPFASGALSLLCVCLHDGSAARGSYVVLLGLRRGGGTVVPAKVAVLCAALWLARCHAHPFVQSHTAGALCVPFMVYRAVFGAYLHVWLAAKAVSANWQ